MLWLRLKLFDQVNCQVRFVILWDYHRCVLLGDTSIQHFILFLINSLEGLWIKDNLIEVLVAIVVKAECSFREWIILIHFVACPSSNEALEELGSDAKGIGEQFLEVFHLG